MGGERMERGYSVLLVLLHLLRFYFFLPFSANNNLFINYKS